MLEDLLAQPESRTLDFKREEVSISSVLQTLVAFANTAGGRVVIGVADDKRVTGVRDAKGEEERYANAIDSGISPPLFPEIVVYMHDGKDLLVLRVPRQSGPFFVRAEGEERGTYVRLGSTNRRADGRTREDLRRVALAQAFDERPCFGASLDDVDMNAVDAAFAPVGLVPNGALMETLGLLARSGEERLPSNGGILLFGTDAARMRLFSQARFRGARFRGTNKASILDQYERPSTVLVGLDEVFAFVQRNTRVVGQIKQAAHGEVPRRVDLPEYGPIALREVLSNAAAHADYSDRGMGIKVFVYDDRLEVESPGGWPIGYSEDDFREGISRQRNKVISDVIRRLKLAEHLGTGYQRIRQESVEMGYPMPEWIEAGFVLRVRLRPHPASHATTATTATTATGSHGSQTKKSLRTIRAERQAEERQTWFLAQIEAGAKPTAEALVARFGIGLRSAWRDIATLREAGRIFFEGTSRHGHYVLVDEARQGDG